MSDLQHITQQLLHMEHSQSYLTRCLGQTGLRVKIFLLQTPALDCCNDDISQVLTFCHLLTFKPCSSLRHARLQLLEHKLLWDHPGAWLWEVSSCIQVRTILVGQCCCSLQLHPTGTQRQLLLVNCTFLLYIMLVSIQYALITKKPQYCSGYHSCLLWSLVHVCIRPG